MNTLQFQPTRPRTVLGEAFFVSLVIEALTLAALAGWLTRQTSKPTLKPLEPIKVMIAMPAPTAPVAKPSPPKAVAAPAKPPVPVEAPHRPPVTPRIQKPSVPKTEPPKEVAPPAAHADSPSQPEQTPAKASDVPPPPANAAPSPPPASQSDAKPSALFEARLRDAVQAAVRYPSAARIMRLSGHVRLGFAYLDGTISNPHVVQSSGRKMLDDAALAALNGTAFPAPPAELKGHLLNLEIVVTFTPSS